MLISSSPDPRWRDVLCVVSVVLAVQFLLVSWTFPISALVADTPLFYIDGAYHWYQMHVARELASQGNLTGYDPFFSAGHTAGVTMNASAKVPALLAAAFGELFAEAQIYKVYVFTAAALAPAFMPIAAGLSGLDRQSTLIATTLGLFAWWASGFRWYHTAGMVSFVLACYLALPYVAGLVRAVYGPGLVTTHVVLLSLVGAVGLFLHPLFPILVVLASLPHLAANWRQTNWARAATVVSVVAILSMLPNVPWVIAMLTAHTTVADIGQYQRRVDLMTIPREMLGLWREDAMGAKAYLGIVISATVAAVAASHAHERNLARASLGAWLLIALFAAVGAAVPGVGTVQPNRFSSAAYLFLALPAGIGVCTLLGMLARAAWRKRIPLAGAGILCASSFGWSAWELAREVSYAPVGHYGPIPPEVRGPGAKSRWLQNWLAENTTPEGRVMFETSRARIHDRAHMAGYYAITSRREFIGGPYPLMFFASYWDGFAFGKPLDLTSVDEFRRLLEIYNIGWIVAHSAKSRQYLSSVPGVVPAGEYDDLSTYRVQQPLSFFIAGSGRIEERGINRVVVADLKDAEVIIKYHYVAGLTADPPARIEQYRLPGIPQPFVRLTDIPGPRLELSIR